MNEISFWSGDKVTASEIIEGLFVGDLFDAHVLAKRGHSVVCVLEYYRVDEPRGAFWIPILVPTLNGYRAEKQQLELAADTIQALLDKGQKVLVHCLQGIERSPLTVAFYLHTKKGMSLDEAYALLMSKRPQVADRRLWLSDDGHDYYAGILSYIVPQTEGEHLKQLALDERGKNWYSFAPFDELDAWEYEQKLREDDGW